MNQADIEKYCVDNGITLKTFLNAFAGKNTVQEQQNKSVLNIIDTYEKNLFKEVKEAESDLKTMTSPDTSANCLNIFKRDLNRSRSQWSAVFRLQAHITKEMSK